VFALWIILFAILFPFYECEITISQQAETMTQVKKSA